MKTLVALLGRTPGAVTSIFYALQEAGYGTMDRIITLTTNAGSTADDCERFIKEEIEEWQDEQEDETGELPTKPKFDPQRISARDLDDETSTDEFQSKIGDILQAAIDQGDEVYLGLAGGRKSMAALAAIAAQFIGADKIKMFHLYVTREIEQCGEIDKLQSYECAQMKSRVMRPLPDDYTLVEVPFGVESRINDFIYHQVQRNPKLLDNLPDKAKEALLSYHYEVKVAEYLERGTPPRKYKYDNAWHQYKLQDQKRQALKGVPPIDVYAERDEPRRVRVLVGECKLQMNETANVSQLYRGLNQLKRDQHAIETFVRSIKDGESQPIEFERWLITNVLQAPQKVIEQAEKEGVQVMYASTPGNWKSSVNWQISKLCPAEALPENA